jgi:hypothetical protein
MFWISSASYQMMMLHLLFFSEHALPLSLESNAQVDIPNYDFLTRDGPSTRLWYEANSIISLSGNIKFYLHNYF